MLIISAISLQSFQDDKIKKIILAGADILRYNFSYDGIDKNINRLKNGRRIIENLNSKVKIMADLPPNKVRLGDFEAKQFAVREGEEFFIKSSKFTMDCNEFIPVNTPMIGKKVYVNQTIPLGDGDIAVQVSEIISPETIKINILNNGIIQAMKGFNINKKINEEIFLKKYKKIIDKLKEFKPYYIAIPFVNEQLNQKILQLFPENWKPKIVLKIENQEAIENLEKIFLKNYYDIIMIDRGELAINLPYEKLGILQKKIVKKAREHRKRIFVSTQILESTIHNYIPSKSDILDLTNLVLDGVNGIMFCKETGFSPRPIYTISVAKKIIQEVESHIK